LASGILHLFGLGRFLTCNASGLQNLLEAMEDVELIIL
jgi:hypothetical protein